MSCRLEGRFRCELPSPFPLVASSPFTLGGFLRADFRRASRRPRSCWAPRAWPPTRVLQRCRRRCIHLKSRHRVEFSCLSPSCVCAASDSIPETGRLQDGVCGEPGSGGSEYGAPVEPSLSGSVAYSPKVLRSSVGSYLGYDRSTRARASRCRAHALAGGPAEDSDLCAVSSVARYVVRVPRSAWARPGPSMVILGYRAPI